MGRSNAARAFALTLAHWGALTLAGISALSAVTLDPIPRAALLLLALALVGAGLAARSRSRAAAVQAGRQQRGTRSEEEVVSALRKARVALIINGAELHAGGDADHVVAHLRGSGTGVLAVVETKSGGGEVRSQGRSIITGKGGRTIPGDPIRQVDRQAAALARLSGRRVTSIVCVPGMTNDPFTVDNVIVCGARHLPAMFARQLPASPLTAADVDHLARTVDPKA